MPSGRPCGQQDGDAGRRAHGAVTPNNGMLQLFTALTQFMWTTLVEQSVLQSKLSAAAPVRAQPGCRQSVWHRTGLNGEIHSKAQLKFSRGTLVALSARSNPHK